jgi:toxin-antitoxin system PIN domain toxin
MRLVDLNVLLYAVNRDSPQHDTVRSWWERALSGDEPVGLAWIVVLGFLRLATNVKVFTQPLTPDEAVERVEAWLTHPNVRLVRETEGHWQILKELLDQAGTAGNLTTDAHLTALAIAHGATLASCDAGFGRFRHLRWENPAAR